MEEEFEQEEDWNEENPEYWEDEENFRRLIEE